MRRASRTDSNHTAVAAQLRTIPGADVIDTHTLGDSFPDLIVGLLGVTVLVEVKAAKGRLSPGQEALQQHWRGGPYLVVREAAGAALEVLRAAEEWRQRYGARTVTSRDHGATIESDW